MKKQKIISAGHVCLDITPEFNERKQKAIHELFLPGQLISMGKADVSIGGSVSNTGLAMKKMGGNVELLGMVSNDAFGRMILNEMRMYDVADSMIVSEEGETSYSVILTPEGIDRIILHHSGVNEEFCLKHIELKKIKDAVLFHFGYPPLMRKMYKDDGQELYTLLKTVHEMGVATSLDMAMIEENTEAGKQNWEEILKKVIPYVDFFLPSIEELCIMIDRERYHEWLERANGKDCTSVLDLEKDIRPLADKLMNWGAKVLCIKCGAPGLYFRTANQERLQNIGGGIGKKISQTWGEKEYFERSYKAEKVLSGTGAGDTTIAAFLMAVLDGYSWQDTLHLAVGTGALCVGTYDPLSGILPLSEVKKKIDQGWEKQ